MACTGLTLLLTIPARLGTINEHRVDDLQHRTSLGSTVSTPQVTVARTFYPRVVGSSPTGPTDLPGGPPSMFIGGDSDEAKATVTELLESTGWDVVDLGGIEASRHLEPMCIVWTLHGIVSGTWNHAFRMLRG